MKLRRIWSVCLIVLGAAAILLGLCQLLWAGAPDAVVRTLGIVMLLTLPVFAFATVRMASQKN